MSKCRRYGLESGFRRKRSTTLIILPVPSIFDTYTGSHPINAIGYNVKSQFFYSDICDPFSFTGFSQCVLHSGPYKQSKTTRNDSILQEQRLVVLLPYPRKRVFVVGGCIVYENILSASG